MIDANGKHHANYSCPSCRHRHPPGWTCAHAAEIAQLGRPRVSVLPPPQRSDAVQLLTDLVNALNATNWSSWQTTHRFDGPLRAANDYLEGLPQ